MIIDHISKDQIKGKYSQTHHAIIEAIFCHAYKISNKKAQPCIYFPSTLNLISEGLKKENQDFQKYKVKTVLDRTMVWEHEQLVLSDHRYPDRHLNPKTMREIAKYENAIQIHYKI
ncbi:MAG: hypothetical protein KKE23_01685 [Nanoarchaeota archaeon]|nr:hypothetical protein [Nanoarchaeota archaeon]